MTREQLAKAIEKRAQRQMDEAWVKFRRALRDAVDGLRDGACLTFEEQENAIRRALLQNEGRGTDIKLSRKLWGVREERITKEILGTMDTLQRLHHEVSYQAEELP